MLLISKDRFQACLAGLFGGLLSGLSLSGLGIFFMLPGLVFLWSATGFFSSGFIWGAISLLISHRWLLYLHPLTWIGVPEVLSLPIVVTIWLLCGCFAGLLVGFWTLICKWISFIFSKDCDDRSFIDQFSFALFVSAIWGIVEVLLSSSPLFWIGLGVGLFPGDLALAGLARWIGGGGLATLELLFGWWIFYLIVSFRRGLQIRKTLVIGILLFQLLHTIGWNLLDHPVSSEKIKVGIWQPSIPTREKFSDEQQQVLPKNLQLALEDAKKLDASFLLAPEGLLQSNQILKTPAPIPLLTGGFHWKLGKQRSSLLFFREGDKKFSNAIDKYRLVPLGEWTPKLPGLGWTGLSAVGGLEAGEPSRLFKWSGPTSAVAICYEIVHHRSLVKAVNEGAEWILSIANLDPYPLVLQKQFLSLARIRSIENSRDILTVTNTGPSAHILASGNFKQLIDPFKVGLKVVNLNLYSGRTGYMVLGEIPLLGAMIFGFALLISKRF